MNKINTQLFGNRIRECRRKHNLTLVQLAEKCDISSNFLGQLERGKNIPSLKTLIKIANILEVSIDGLLFENLEKISGQNHFLDRVEEITNNYTSSQKLIIIEGLELLKGFTDND